VPLSFISSAVAVGLKCLIAAAGAGLLAGRLLMAGRPIDARTRRLQDTALAVLAVLAFAGWWNFGRFHFPGYTHPHEFFHYYLGAKYAPELGYTGLYDCTAAVEAEQGTPDIATRWTRDLRDNRVIQGSPAASNPSLCEARFTPARWKEFTHDVLFFRSRVSTRKWQQMQTDHGYNATPVWTISGRLLASSGPITRRKMLALALVDPALLLVMWAVVWWAFGWRTTAVALLWWGTNYPARYNYIGGAFLREDWLVLAVAAIALARRGWLAGGGAALGASTVLRIFPGFLSLGPGLQLLMARTPGTARAVLRVAASAVAAVAILVPLSWMAVDGGVAPGIARWQGFVDNSRKHLSGTATNRVSLKTVVSYDPAQRLDDLRDYWLDGPGDAWQAARHTTFQRRQAVYWLIVLAFVVSLARAVRREPVWAAMVLGIGLVPVAADITCYYYGILLAYAFLAQRRPWIGVGLATLAALTCVAAAIWEADEDKYAAISVLVVLYVCSVTGWIAWGERAAVEETVRERDRLPVTAGSAI
jgi:hypothetical protein